jgi:toxin YoeB
MKPYETKKAREDKTLILKSFPKTIQAKLFYFVNDILDNPRNLNTVGSPEELKHKKIPTFSRELTKKDRIVYEIKNGTEYGLPNEPEIVVFLQYLGHYDDK